MYTINIKFKKSGIHGRIEVCEKWIDSFVWKNGAYELIKSSTIYNQELKPDYINKHYQVMVKYFASRNIPL